MADKVVIGLDGSDGSVRALNWLVARIAGDRTEVVAVHAIRPLREFLLDLPGIGLDHWRSNLRWQLEEQWCKPLAEAGIRYRAVTVEDKPPATAISSVAAAEDADMIVVGAQGHGRVADRLLGSVSYKLAHSTDQPVVIVPPHWLGDWSDAASDGEAVVSIS